MTVIIIQDGHENPFHQFTEKLNSIIQNLKIMALTLADVQKKTDDLIAQVKAEDTEIDSAIALINSNVAILADISAQLKVAIAASDPAALQAVSDGIDNTITDMKAKTDQIAAALVADTPAAPTA